MSPRDGGPEQHEVAIGRHVCERSRKVVTVKSPKMDDSERRERLSRLLVSTADRRSVRSGQKLEAETVVGSGAGATPVDLRSVRLLPRCTRFFVEAGAARLGWTRPSHRDGQKADRPRQATGTGRLVGTRDMQVADVARSGLPRRGNCRRIRGSGPRELRHWPVTVQLLSSTA